MPNTHTTHIYTNTWCWSQVFRAFMATVYGRDSILIISLLKHYLEQFALYENHRWVIMKLAGICINLVVITTCRHVLQLSNQSNPVFFFSQRPWMHRLEQILNTDSLSSWFPYILPKHVPSVTLFRQHLMLFFIFFSLCSTSKIPYLQTSFISQCSHWIRVISSGISRRPCLLWTFLHQITCCSCSYHLYFTHFLIPSNMGNYTKKCLNYAF